MPPARRVPNVARIRNETAAVRTSRVVSAPMTGAGCARLSGVRSASGVTGLIDYMQFNKPERHVQMLWIQTLTMWLFDYELHNTGRFFLSQSPVNLNASKHLLCYVFIVPIPVPTRPHFPVEVSIRTLLIPPFAFQLFLLSSFSYSYGDTYSILSYLLLYKCFC